MIRELFHLMARIAIACAALIAVSVAAQEASPVPPGQTPPGFTSQDVQVNGSSLHYLRGGEGPALILLHGFPEDWAAWLAIMPRLAKGFTVIAVDLPGLGRSGPPPKGYAAAGLAAQIHGLAQALQLEWPYLVGHDLGGLIAYAYVRSFPEALRGAMILEAPMPGLAGSEEAGKGMWHVGFMQTRGLPEKLVPGREAAFLGWFYDLGTFTPEERQYYVRAYGEPQLVAAFEIYRALPQAAEWNAARMEPNTVPLVVGVGEKSFFAKLLPTFVEAYRVKGMAQVEGARIPGAGHYLLADNPEGVAQLIEKHAVSDAP